MRKAITAKISCIFNLLEPKEWDKHLYDIIVELLDDEEAEVKNLAIEGFLYNIHKFSENLIEENMSEMLIKLVNDMAGGDSPDESILITQLDDLLKNSQLLRKIIMKTEYSGHNQVIYRAKYFIETLGSDYFFKNMFDMYLELIKNGDEKDDEGKSPRWYITDQISEVIAWIGAEQWYAHEFDKQVTYIMHSKDMHCVGRLLENLPEIIEIFTREDIPEDTISEVNLKKKTNLIRNNLLKLEDAVKDNWRYLNLWIDWWYRVLLKMHEECPPESNQLDDTSLALSKFLPHIYKHLKKGSKSTRELWILFLVKLLKVNQTPGYLKEIFDLATSLPFTTWWYKRVIYLELLEHIVSHVSKKTFCDVFIDSYYMLSKDKWASIIIKFCQITPKIFKKVSYDDPRNKERIINIIKALKENLKYIGSTNEQINETYAELLNLQIFSASQKKVHEEEEKVLSQMEMKSKSFGKSKIGAGARTKSTLYTKSLSKSDGRL